MPVVQLNPCGKRAIADLLEQSYDCISPTSDRSRTWASRLKEYPTYYLRYICSEKPEVRASWSGDYVQKTMDWASWELARSTLDESIKNSVGILLYLDKVKRLPLDPVRETIQDFGIDYLSSFAYSSLYFCHLHATLSGLSLAGVIFRDGRVVVRDVSSSPRWIAIDDSWEECWDRTTYARHVRIFKQYDAVQRNRAKWLPRRSEELRALKKGREAITYHTERLGGWNQREAVDRIKEAFPFHMAFQQQILEPLYESVEDKTWNRSFNPKLRTNPLRTRFDQYQSLATSCLR